MNIDWRMSNRSIIYLAIALPLAFCFMGAAYIKTSDLRPPMYQHLRIMDRQGRPIPAVTIWRIDKDAGASIDVSLMRRLVNRFSQDADFVEEEVHPRLMISYSDNAGVFVPHEDLTDSSVAGTVVFYGIIKRGYTPAVVSVGPVAESTNDINITLDVNRAAKVSTAMLELDRLRAESQDSGDVSANIMSEERRLKLLAIQQRLRNLAITLEANKENDDASAIYFALAYLPSVDVVRNASGNDVIVGYSNGYNENSLQRIADLNKAIAINKTNPNLALERIRLSLGSKNLMLLSNAAAQIYLKMAERLIAERPDSIWTLLHFLHPQYLRLGMYDQACMALRREYVFEPTYFSSQQWEGQLGELNKKASIANYNGGICTLPVGAP